MDMVEQTGIMTVPGSGFGQMPGTYHFRITNLVTPNERMQQVLDRLVEFNDKWQAEHWFENKSWVRSNIDIYEEYTKLSTMLNGGTDRLEGNYQALE